MMFDVCATGDTAHINMIFMLLPHKRQLLTRVLSKKNFFSFPVAVNNSIKVGPLVFLL